MRTKALFLTAALGVASIATSMAQVYSVNAVGYVNVSIPKAAAPAAITYAMLANPLNGTNNNINTILPNVPDGAQLFKFTPGSGFIGVETFIAGLGWDPGTATLPPGDGFFLALDNATAANPQVITFVGEVPQGNLVNPIPNGYSLKSSMVPQSGALTGALGLEPQSDSQVFKWNVAAQRYETTVYTYLGGGIWDPSDPVIGVAEGFFILNAGTAMNWSRNFTVQ